MKIPYILQLLCVSSVASTSSWQSVDCELIEESDSESVTTNNVDTCGHLWVLCIVPFQFVLCCPCGS